MRFIKLVLISATFFVLNVKCKDDKVQVTDDVQRYIKAIVQPVFGTENLLLDSTYLTQQGYEIQFSNVKFYLENIQNDGNTIVESALFDYRESGIDLFTEASESIVTGDFSANVGVGPDLNHLDPSAFDIDDPLNILNANDMHWNWNPGYIFLKIEARVDTIQDGMPQFDHNVVYHIGLDENLQTIEFENLNWEQVDLLSIARLKVDLSEFLNSPEIIDVKTESSSHSSAGQEALTTKVISNFSQAISPY